MKNLYTEKTIEKKRELEIIDYYNQCTVDYKLVWHLNSEMCLHYGYWEKHTASLRTAIRNMNYKLAEFGNITANKKILDAGCGAGGSSIFLAQHYQAQVTGIALPELQIAACKANAQKFGLEHVLHFDVQNYCCTTLPSQSFDIVWAIESVCHAENKAHFLQEAFRLLKPGGTLLIADFFKNDNPSSWLQKMEKSWSIPSFASIDNFKSEMEIIGFTDIKIEDKSNAVYPSVTRLYACYFPGILISKTMEWLGLRTKRQTENTRSCLYQYKAFKSGDWNYSFICAQKPDA